MIILLQDDQSAGGNGAGEGYAYFPGGKSIYLERKNRENQILIFYKKFVNRRCAGIQESSPSAWRTRLQGANHSRWERRRCCAFVLNYK